MKPTYMSIGILPKPNETTVIVDDPHVSEIDGRTNEITCLVMGQARIQFDHYAKAQAWLAECSELLAAALAERDKPSDIAA